MRPDKSTERSPKGLGASDLLREVAGPDLYRRNAFRLLQVPFDATERAITQQLDRLKIEEKLGGKPAPRAEMLTLEPPPNLDTIRQAVQRLREPRRRLVEELFWFWPDGPSWEDAALAALSDGDLRRVDTLWQQNAERNGSGQLATHNLAVLHHAAALDLEARGQTAALSPEEVRQRDSHWRESLQHWRLLLNLESFWIRLAERVRAVDDPRLTTGFVHRLREALPSAVLGVLGQLAVRAAEAGTVADARRFRQLAQESGFAKEAVEGAFRDSTQALRDRLGALCQSASRQVDEGPTQAHTAAMRLLEQAKTLLATLDRLLPASDSARQAAHDEVALAVLAGAVAYGNKTTDWKTCLEILQALAGLAASDSARQRIEENRKTVEGNLGNQSLWGTCFFCGNGKPAESAGKEVKLYGEVQRTQTWQGVEITWRKATIRVPRCMGCQTSHARVSGAEGLGCGLGVLMGVIAAVITMIAGGEGFSVVVGLSIAASGSGLGWAVGRSRLPAGTRPEGLTKAFPEIQQLLAKGWQVGEKPVP